MSTSQRKQSPGDGTLNDKAIRAAAARWSVLCDRGLSESEVAEFELWRAADPRHSAALKRFEDTWKLFAQAPESLREEFRGMKRRPSFASYVGIGGIAAALAVGLVIWRASIIRHSQPVASVSTVLAVDQSLSRAITLSDGSTVLLNVESEVTEHFSPTERRVELVKGEAHFMVTKNAARPFVVHAGSVEIRAIGTAFDVKLEAIAVNLLVTEGKVQVHSWLEDSPPSAISLPGDDSGDDDKTQTAPSFVRPPVLVSFGEKAIIPLRQMSGQTAVVVSHVDPSEMAAALAWKKRVYLNLGGAKLSDIVIEFERRTGEKIVFADAGLGDLRVAGLFPADDLEGFVRLLGENYDLTSKRTPAGMVIRRKRR